MTLSWWQKLLKAVGLYKVPASPPRGERIIIGDKPAREPRPAKSNTRNARTNEGSGSNDEVRSDEERPRRAKRKPADRPRGGDGSTVESPRVYVGNLSYDATEQDLQELFKGIGGVRNVEIVYNRSTHRSKGYGFVEMLHMDEAVRAVEVLHDQPFMGRKMMVSGAKSKGQDEREDADDAPQTEQKRVVVAPLPSFDEPETAAAEVAEVEPEIQTIVENVTEAPAEVAAEAEAAPEVAAPEVAATEEAAPAEAPAEEEPKSGVA